MAIAFVNAQTAQLNAANTTLACNTPSGIADGNLMVTILELNAAVTVTPPGGWTHATGFAVTSGTNVLDAYYRVASSEPASYTWSFGSAKCNIACLGYSGTPASSPVDVSNAASTTSPSASTPTITTTGSADWIISAFSDRDSAAGSTWTTPAGTTPRANLLNTGSSEGSLAVFDTNGTVAAGSYSYSSTASTTQSNAVAGIIAILTPAATATWIPAETAQYGGYFF